MKLQSERVRIHGARAAVELFFERRWTDGLAIVPPTEEAVVEMIECAGRDAGEVLGEVPPYGGIATIEKLAINAVMAGCLPEYFPVVIAAAEAALDPRHNLNGTQTTQSGTEQLIIVNGPIVKQLGLNSGDGLFGRGYRANGTIGRALRLMLWNLGRNYPGDPDKSTLSHPGAWTFCIAENEDASPWEPLHLQRGLAGGSSGVTVFCCEAPHPFMTFGTVDQVLFTACEAMANPGSGNHIFHYEAEVLLVFSALVAEQFRREGWTKQDVRDYVWQHARVPYWKIEKVGILTAPFLALDGGSAADLWWPKSIDRSSPEALIPITTTPEDIHILIGGGRGAWSSVCHGWGMGGRAVTKAVRPPSPTSSRRQRTEDATIAEVLSPAGEKKRVEIDGELAARPASLSGKVVGIVADGIKGRTYFRRLEELLRQECNPAEIIYMMKPHEYLYRPAPTEFMDEVVRTCDVVIRGVAT